MTEAVLANSSKDSEPTRDRLLADGKATAKACGHLSRILGENADKHKKLQRLIHTANFVVGIGVVSLTLLSLVPAYSLLTGQNAVAILAFAAAAALLADTALPSILSEPNPERFKDYALYIRNYAQELKGLETNHALDYIAWRARNIELVRMARMNMDDVLRQWPWMVDKVKQCGVKEYWED